MNWSTRVRGAVVNGLSDDRGIVRFRHWRRRQSRNLERRGALKSEFVGLLLSFRWSSSSSIEPGTEFVAPGETESAFR